MRNRPLYLCLALLLLVASCGSTQSDFTGKIAVTVISSRWDNSFPSDITLIRVIPGGAMEYSLFEDPVREGWAVQWDCLRWSPDGNRLAIRYRVDYSRPWGYEGLLGIVDADGSNWSELAWTDSCTAWSPDGGSLLYSNRGHIYMVGFPSRKLTILTQLPRPKDYYLSHFDWSPDGTRILYDNGGEAIYELNLDGSEATSLIGPCEGCRFLNPRYSPDGEWIVFAWDKPTRSGVHRMRNDGSQVERLHAGSDPAWSLDGSQIAFIDAGCVAIRVMSADGSKVRTLIQSREWNYYDLDWGP